MWLLCRPYFKRGKMLSQGSSEKKSSSGIAPIKLDSYFALVNERDLLANKVPISGFESALEYLSRAISQEPRNLRLHIQRIFLLLRKTKKNKSILASAITDLFIILQESGAVLKARVLKMSYAHLHIKDWAYLKFNEHSGLTTNTPTHTNLNCFSHSLLSHGLIGHADFIERTVSTQPHDTQIIELHEQALMCLEYGQLDVALSLLQQAMAADPNNAEVKQDLLSIYMSLGMETEHNALSQEIK